MNHSAVDRDRELLEHANAAGGASRWLAFVRLSGPGWLQSAITLGGGSLAGALFLGILGGTDLLWLQLVAIVMGVIMLSAISYVALSTGEKPFRAINQHINPVLGWGWIIATCMANMIWCMPQFSLCYAALRKNLIGESVGDATGQKLLISGMILVAALFVLWLNGQKGLAGRVFDIFLKAMVGMIVICFFGVVVILTTKGQLEWGRILSGFVPDPRQWTQPTGQVRELLATLPESVRVFWTERVVAEQRAVMIGAAATAVGINMTFLLPYSMLNRGWDKTFRGFARFDLCTGMAIPYVLVTSCVVIAAATMFHGKIDEAFLSTDSSTMQSSPIHAKAQKQLVARVQQQFSSESPGAMDPAEIAQSIAELPENEKRVAAFVARRDAFQLSQALSPLLGDNWANWAFGLGIFGMGFSSIIILMLINGYAFCEICNQPQGGWPHWLGCAVAGFTGAIWPLVWDGPAKLWLAILASSFGMMLLPIAYFTFLMMMNSKSLLGDEKPRGLAMLVWNILMGISVLGAVIAAVTAVWDKSKDPTRMIASLPFTAGNLVITIAAVYLLLVAVGFMKTRSVAPS